MKADIITYAINTLRTIHERKEKYREVNQQISELQVDFPTVIQFADTEFLTSAVDMIDAILCNNASYWLWECNQDGSVTHEDGMEYPLVTISDIEAYARKFSPYAQEALSL